MVHANPSARMNIIHQPLSFCCHSDVDFPIDMAKPGRKIDLLGAGRVVSFCLLLFSPFKDQEMEASADISLIRYFIYRPVCSPCHMKRSK